MADPEILNWLTQGGSFGLVCGGAWYVAKVLIPKTLAAFERINADNANLLREMQSKFDEHARRQEERSDRREAMRDAAIERLAASLDKLSDKVNAVADRIEDLENDTFGSAGEQPPTPRRRKSKTDQE